MIEARNLLRSIGDGTAARPGFDTGLRVQRVMEDYKRRFAQESVLRLVTNAWAGF